MERNRYDNMKYTDHREIQMLISLRKLNKVFGEDDVMIWCQQLEKNMLADVDNFFTYIEIPLSVSNSRTLLPCNVGRILDVYLVPGNASSRIPFSTNGDYLFFHPTMLSEYVYIDYVGTPISDDGIPMILRGHEMACVSWCIYNAYFGDMIDDKMSMGSRQMIVGEKDAELSAAMSSSNYRFRTRGSNQNNSVIRGDQIHKIGNIPLYTKELAR